MLDGLEQVLIQPFMANCSVVTLDIGILSRPAISAMRLSLTPNRNVRQRVTYLSGPYLPLAALGRDLPEAEPVLHSILTSCARKRLKSALRMLPPIARRSLSSRSWPVLAAASAEANGRFGES